MNKIKKITKKIDEVFVVLSIFSLFSSKCFIVVKFNSYKSSHKSKSTIMLDSHEVIKATSPEISPNKKNIKAI